MGEGEPYRVSPATESRPGLLRGSHGHGLRPGSLLPLARLSPESGPVSRAPLGLPAASLSGERYR